MLQIFVALVIIRHRDINKYDCLRHNNSKSRHKKITRSYMLSENLKDFDSLKTVTDLRHNRKEGHDRKEGTFRIN